MPLKKPPLSDEQIATLAAWVDGGAQWPDALAGDDANYFRALEQTIAGGLDEDAAGLRKLLAACDEVIIAQSCDKNFSVYRDRVGSLFVKTASADTTARAMAHVFQRAREMWSMPPDHGAAAVRIILDDPRLRSDWLVELGAMRDRINSVRARIAAADPRLAFIGRQFGMFSMLPLSKEQVTALRTSHGIYMADSGRFNVVGMSDEAVDRHVDLEDEIAGHEWLRGRCLFSRRRPRGVRAGGLARRPATSLRTRRPCRRTRGR